MKYLLKHRIPYDGKIIPRQTVLPSKHYPMVSGQTKERLLKRGWLVEIDESKVKIVRKDNQVILMDKFEQANQEANIEVETPIDNEATTPLMEVSGDNLDNMKVDELKVLAIQHGIRYVAVKKADLIKNLREVI